MRSDVLIVARPGRTPHIEGRGAIAGRRTHSDTVHLVSSAATPLGGDAISIRIIVECRARLSVRTVAATVAHVYSTICRVTTCSVATTGSMGTPAAR